MRCIVRKSHWTIAVLAFVSTGFTAESPIVADTESESTTQLVWEDLIGPPLAEGAEQFPLQYTTYTDALASNSLDEALIVAKRMVEIVNAIEPVSPLARARALRNLAVAQQLRGDSDSAILNYHAAIESVVSEEGDLSGELIMPFRGLAITYAQTGQPDKAFGAFGRALHINNVTVGPHNLQQLQILKSTMQLHLEQDDPDAAYDVFDRIHQIYLRNYQGNDEEILPALREQADYYRQIHRYPEERAALLHMLRITREQKSHDDLSLVELNLNIARNIISSRNSFGARGFSTRTARSYLNDALSVAESNAEADWKVRKRCLLALADYHTVLAMHAEANRYYQRAWHLMSARVERLVVRAADLESTIPLSQPPTNPYANFTFNPDRDKIDQSEYLQGEMVVTFTVTRQGRARNLQFHGSQPADFEPMEWRVRNTLRRFVYRPRYADGLPVEVVGQQYRVEYYYLPSEYAAASARSGQ